VFAATGIRVDARLVISLAVTGRSLADGGVELRAVAASQALRGLGHAAMAVGNLALRQDDLSRC
jgi:hypothetical protein